MASPVLKAAQSPALIGRIDIVLLKLGLSRWPTEPRPELESPPPPTPEATAPPDEVIRDLELLESELAQSAAFQESAAGPTGVPEDVAEAVLYWLARYSMNSTLAARNIRELAAKEPQRVVETALPIYEEGRWAESSAFLGRLLAGDGRVATKLCDPGGSLDRSVGLVKMLMRHEPRFDASFAKILLSDTKLTEAERQRGLAVLEKLGSAGRLTPILIQFLRDPDIGVRSKAALLFGQIMLAQGITDRLIGDQDPRVRANFIEGLWKCKATQACRTLFRQALEDSHHRVVGNALVGLHRLGEIRDVIRHVGKMARRQEALFRATAAWVMGQTGDACYRGVLVHMTRDPDILVRRNAMRSLEQIGGSGAADSGQTAVDNKSADENDSGCSKG